MTSTELRKQVNERLIEALSKDILPWRRPWSPARTGGRHRNFVSQRAYSGVNPLLLELHNLKHGFGSSVWLTFNQAKAIGCTVNKRPDHVPPGQWGCNVVFCKPVTKTTVDQDTGEEERESFFMLRSFTVFNIDQVSGPAVDQLRDGDLRPVIGTDYPTAQALIEASGAKLIHGGDKAFYVRPTPEEAWPNHTNGDYIMAPERRRFESSETYFETLFHELAHWSEVRLGWDHRKKGYSMGELVAEISATYLATELGMPLADLDNHAAYLKTWLEGMRESPGFIFGACSAASRVTDYLLGFVQPTEEAVSEDSVTEPLAVASV